MYNKLYFARIGVGRFSHLKNTGTYTIRVVLRDIHVYMLKELSPFTSSGFDTSSRWGKGNPFGLKILPLNIYPLRPLLYYQHHRTSINQFDH